MLIFLGLAGYLVYFNAVKSDSFINSPYNTRQDTFADRVVRGSIISSDGEVLAQTNVSEDGTEERSYPYSNIFAHVVGYDTNGKSGLESEANFQLLSSHEFFLTQIRNEFAGAKNVGDTVVSTLNADLQTTAYNSLGDRRGAVVVLQPSTGKILAMVSKPDFDPNTIAANWEQLVNDETNSSLLNRATMGQYPPGSTFKIVTALTYLRQNGTFNGFSYDCAFAEMGTQLGGDALLKTSEDLLFNQKLPLNSYRKSSFTLNGNSGVPLTMQTSIGQGNTLVSPMHMALITSSVANGGVLMKPYLIDKVQNAQGDEIDTTEPTAYKRLMTDNEAALLGELMKGVVQNGTASSLNGRGYTVAGKTGSAEYNESGASHSWFVGYSNVDDPDIVVSIIVEDGGTGSEAAVPIAADIFDAYYFD